MPAGERHPFTSHRSSRVKYRKLQSFDAAEEKCEVETRNSSGNSTKAGCCVLLLQHQRAPSRRCKNLILWILGMRFQRAAICSLLNQDCCLRSNLSCLENCAWFERGDAFGRETALLARSPASPIVTSVCHLVDPDTRLMAFRNYYDLASNSLRESRCLEAQSRVKINADWARVTFVRGKQWRVRNHFRSKLQRSTIFLALGSLRSAPDFSDERWCRLLY